MGDRRNKKNLNHLSGSFYIAYKWRRWYNQKDTLKGMGKIISSYNLSVSCR